MTRLTIAALVGLGSSAARWAALVGITPVLIVMDMALVAVERVGGVEPPQSQRLVVGAAGTILPFAAAYILSWVGSSSSSNSIHHSGNHSAATSNAFVISVDIHIEYSLMASVRSIAQAVIVIVASLVMVVLWFIGFVLANPAAGWVLAGCAIVIFMF